MARLEITILVASLILLAIIVEVVRRRRLSEGYALLWIGVGVGVLVLGVLRPLVDRVSRLVGVHYGASLIFGVAVVFLVVVCVNLSMHVSRLEERVQALAEEIALLRGARHPAPGSPEPEGDDPDPAAEVHDRADDARGSEGGGPQPEADSRAGGPEAGSPSGA
jgi:hypothetical protein